MHCCSIIFQQGLSKSAVTNRDSKKDLLLPSKMSTLDDLHGHYKTGRDFSPNTSISNILKLSSKIIITAQYLYQFCCWIIKLIPKNKRQ